MSISVLRKFQTPAETENLGFVSGKFELNGNGVGRLSGVGKVYLTEV